MQLRIVFVVVLVGSLRASAADVDYLADIKPLLSAKCYACHGSLQSEAELRLETKTLMLRGGDAGPAVVDGEPDKSLILKRVTAAGEERMPPADAGAALTTREVNLIRRWIRQGAHAPDEAIPLDPAEHWAFSPIVRPRPPAMQASWIRSPIDAFVAAKHQELGLQTATEAAAPVLIRRLSFDLTGLPPTPHELAVVMHNPQRDWYGRTVERLLNDPAHSERWARHWMDVWRYSDWNGFNGQLRGSQKHIWHWRDWIVDSISADLPYDEMVRLMLAADELHPTDPDKLRATGYLARNYVLFNRNQWMDETIEHLGKAFLGLTMNCAKCHDHKYDPIRQRDYYAMRAFFEPYHVRLDLVAGEPDLTVDGLPRVFDGWLDKPTYLFTRGDEKRPDESEEIAPDVPEFPEVCTAKDCSGETSARFLATGPPALGAGRLCQSCGEKAR